MTRTSPVFTGVAVALVTFFDEHGHVDLGGHRSATPPTSWAAACESVVVAGSTGEASHLIDEGAAPAPRRGEGGRARAACRSSSARATCPPGSACRTSPAGPPSTVRPPPSPSRPTTATSASSTARSSMPPGSMPVIAYHWPQVSAPGITIEELKAVKVAALKDSTGDCERLLEELAHFHKPIYTGSAAIVAFAGQLGLRRRHPRRRQPRTRALRRRVRRQHPGPEGPAVGAQADQHRRRQGDQGGAGPPLRHQHRLPVAASPGADRRAMGEFAAPWRAEVAHRRRARGVRGRGGRRGRR